MLFQIHFFSSYVKANPNAQNTAYETAINEVSVPVLNRDVCNEWLDSLNVTDGKIFIPNESHHTFLQSFLF